MNTNLGDGRLPVRMGSNKKEVLQMILFELMSDVKGETMKTQKREITQTINNSNHLHYVVLLKNTGGFRALYARTSDKTGTKIDKAI